MPLEGLVKEALSCGQIAPFAKPELDGITIAVDSALKVHPSTADLDVRFINVPFACDGPLT
jgi:hypothetical protein